MKKIEKLEDLVVLLKEGAINKSEFDNLKKDIIYDNRDQTVERGAKNLITEKKLNTNGDKKSSENFSPTKHDQGVPKNSKKTDSSKHEGFPDVRQWHLGPFRYFQFFGYFIVKKTGSIAGSIIIAIGIVLLFLQENGNFIFDNLWNVFLFYAVIVFLVLPVLHYLYIRSKIIGYQFGKFKNKRRYLFVNESIVLDRQIEMHPGYNSDFISSVKGFSLNTLMYHILAGLKGENIENSFQVSDLEKLLYIFSQLRGNEFDELIKNGNAEIEFNLNLSNALNEYHSNGISEKFKQHLNKLIIECDKFGKFKWEVLFASVEMTLERGEALLSKIIKPATASSSSSNNSSRSTNKAKPAANNTTATKVEKDSSTYNATLEFIDEFDGMARYRAHCGKCGKRISGGSRGGLVYKSIKSDYTSYSEVSRCSPCGVINKISL